MQASPDLQAPVAPPAPARVVVSPGVSAPEAVYRAFNEQRKELRNQLDQLEGKRNDIQNQLSNDGMNAKLRSGLELRVADLDKRIADVDKELAAADQQVAKAAAIPGQSSSVRHSLATTRPKRCSSSADCSSHSSCFPSRSPWRGASGGGEPARSRHFRRT